MSDNAPRTNGAATTVTISPRLRAKLARQQTRYWRRMAQRHPQEQRYFVRNVRALARNPIRGQLVTHRRMFGVSHKSVQPGQKMEE